MLVVCKACGKGCDAGCDALQATCGGLSDCLCPYDRPSPVFVIFSSICNLVLVAFGAVGLTVSVPTRNLPGVEEPDTSDIDMWLAVALGIGVVNIVFACYIYYKFSKMTSWRAGRERQSATSAAWHLCAYDIGVCLYMCFSIFMMVWVFMDKTCDEREQLPEESFCEDKKHYQDMCVIAIWVYAALGGCVMMMSICTSVCNPPNPPPGYQGQYQQQGGGVAVAPPPQPAYAAYNSPAPQQQQQQQQYQQYQQPGQPATSMGGYPAAPGPENNWGDAPNQQQQQQSGTYTPPPQQQGQQQNQSAAQKAGALAGGLLGKAVGKLK